MRTVGGLAVLLFAYLLVIFPFTGHMQSRPVAVRLGYIPRAEVVRMVARDFRFLLSEAHTARVMFYFGTLTSPDVSGPISYAQMYEQLVQAAKLDPYNQDIYYFSQAIFTWDVGRAKEVNKLLEYGMRYRAEDWMLPYWAGFNAAYFLKDYESAARYFQRAAELSESQLFTKLAARYFHESGEGALGVIFLDSMIKGAKDPNIKKVYEVRRSALEASLELQDAVSRYTAQRGSPPAHLEDLIAKGFIVSIPDDPYGGVFYLDDSGRVVSTSKFAFADNSTESPAGSGVGIEFH